MFMSSSRNKSTLLYQNSVTDIFDGFRPHVGAHTGGHQHGVSIQISINVGKTFLRISYMQNILVTWILARVFAYLPPFIPKILELIYWKVLIFILIVFEWLNTENQQYLSRRQGYPTFEGQNLKSANSTHTSTFYSVMWFVFRHCQHHYVLDSVLCKLNTTRGLDPNPTLAPGLTHKIHRDESARSGQNRQWRPQQVSSMDRKCSSPKIIYIN